MLFIVSMKKIIFICILIASPFSYSSPCEDAMRSPKTNLIKHIEQILENSDVSVRSSMAVEFLEMAYRKNKSSFDVVFEAMKSSSVELRLGAVEVSVKIVERSLENLDKSIGNSMLVTLFLSNAVRILKRKDELALLLSQALESSNVWVRLGAVRAAGEVGESVRSLLESKGLSVLREVLENPDVRVRLMAVEAAVEMGESARSLLESKGLSVLREALKDLDVEVRLRTVAVAVEMGESAIPVLREALKDSDVEVRLRTVEAALEIGESAIPVLREALKDSDVEVRLRVVEVAGETRAIPVLSAALKDSSWSVRFRAVEAIGEVGESIRSLKGLSVLGQLGNWMLKLGHSIFELEALSVLREALESSDIWVRLRAIEAAIEMGKSARSLLESKGLSVLREALENPDVRVRLMAVEVALEMGESARSLLESKGLSILREALENLDVRVRLMAVEVAGKMGESARSLLESKVISVLSRALESSDVEVRIRVVKIVLGIGESAVPVLREVLENSSEIEIISLRAVEAAVEIGDPARSLLESKGFSVLDLAMESPSDYISARAFKIASTIPGFLSLFLNSKKLSVVRKAMESPSVMTSLSAVEAALEIGDPARSLLESKGLFVLDQALEYSIWKEPEYEIAPQDSIVIFPIITGFGVGIRTVNLIAKVGEPAVPVLRKALTHTNVQTLMEAIEVALEIGGSARSLLQSEGVAALERVLEHPLAWMFGSRAVKVAGKIRAIPILRKALEHSSEEVRSAAVEEIKKIGGPALSLLN